MFGTTYPMFGFETTLSERLRDPALADYIRWEYRPADQPRIVLSVRGGSIRSAGGTAGRGEGAGWGISETGSPRVGRGQPPRADPDDRGPSG